MSVTTQPTPDSARRGTRKRFRRPAGVGTAMLARGESMIWLTGGALAVCLLMIVGLLGMVIWLGFATFYPLPVHHVELHDGTIYMGEVTRDEPFPLDAQSLLSEPEPIARAAVAALVEELGGVAAVREIPAALADLNEELDHRRQELQDRIEQVDQRVEYLRQALAPPDRSPEARAAHIRRFGRIDEFEKAHGFLLTLNNELESIRQQKRVNAEAIAHFERAGSDSEQPAVAVSDAEPAFRQAGLTALLRMKADRDGTNRAMAHRRQFRTGNYELTNTHFHWVRDYQVKPGHDTLPEWALVVERQTWGRFYGTPERFERHFPRPEAEDEAELAEIIDFLSGNLHRADESRRESLEQHLTELRERLQAKRRRESAEFAGRFQQVEAALLEAETEDGTRVPLSELSSEAVVRTVIRTDSGPESAYARFRQFHAPARDRFAERYSLAEHGLGDANLQQERARLAVRQAEIDHGIDGIVDRAEALVEVTKRIDAYRQPGLDARRLADRIAALPESGPQADLARETADALERESAEQTADLEQQRRQLEAELSELPGRIPAAVRQLVDRSLQHEEQTREIHARIRELSEEDARLQLILETAQGQAVRLPLGEIVRAYPANRLGTGEKLGIYFSRAWEFLTANPREANSEGGVFPAIWGTVAMTLIMSLAVAPFGVLAALYLREYAKAGPIVSVIRVSINNLAGVPSIVFGVFGLSFFCYGVGKWVDGGAGAMAMEIVPWLIWLSVCALFATVAFTVGMIASAGHPGTSYRWKRFLRLIAFSGWMAALVTFLVLLAWIPSEMFGGFYAANLPNPTFGKGGILWASLTLALLTLPVVIVATEEALAAVPNSMREGSYGCGAGKWQTIRRIVLPHALPGIMTGMILAMARGAGEVAPLMLVGAVKLAPDLPVDLTAPFLHLERSFMHLGFHIFDLGFQSQNSEAAKPMVFTTTLLLIGIIACLNLMAIWLRGALRKRFGSGHF